MKGSCHQVPCEWSKGNCQCKTICINCCGGQPDCYRLKKFQEKPWIKTPTSTGKQLTLFTNEN